MISTSSPTPEVSRLTVSLVPKMAGSPTTHRVPRTAPDTDARPPITAIETADSDMSTGNWSARALVSSAISSAPAKPARPPARAKADSFVARGAMVNAAADGSLSRTATSARPTPERRSRLARSTTTTSAARQTR